MKVRTTVVELLKAEPEWRQLLKRCCEKSSLRLRSQVGQWRDELADRGHNFPPADVEDALIDLARSFFPNPLVLSGTRRGPLGFVKMPSPGSVSIMPFSARTSASG
jgi:hypothetical protein